QHAAHERLVYERLKGQFTEGRIAAQPLLLPTIVACTPAEASLVLAHAEELQKFGLEVESYSPTAIAVTAIPQVLGESNPTPLVRDLITDLQGLTPPHHPQQPLRARAGHHRLSSQHSRPPQAEHCGAERPPAPNGIHPRL
ncbi:hypothetical protein, partial [Escherichia coli]|uniref:hypothetical protein n=1 Tax=Escherichia coli TaxID=562 RepID=UPI003F7A0254